MKVQSTVRPDNIKILGERVLIVQAGGCNGVIVTIYTLNTQNH